MRKYSNIEWTKTGLRLLEKSVELWKKQVETGVRHDCPLCEEYTPNNSDDDLCCRGCPIPQFTGRRGCIDTPFVDWLCTGYRSPEETAAAKKELAFLKRLAANGRKILEVTK